MSGMFDGTTAFNQDITGWCVSQFSSEPGTFSPNSSLTSANNPVWGKEFTIALTSGSQTQTVTATTAITPIQYTVSSICTTTLSVSASNLPSGVSAALSNNVVTISGTPAATATGTFNYSLTVSGSTTGQTVTGTITVNEAQIYIPDNAFEQKLIDLGYDDILDNYVLESNIIGITTLQINNVILDATGIEAFSSLTTLLLRGEITSINLSNNTNLTSLVLINTQLTSINLSSNVSLERLTISASKIQSLDLTDNINLNFVNVGVPSSLMSNINFYSLTSIDFPNTNTLTNVQLSGNYALTNVDITNLSSLEQFYGEYIGLNSLDTSNNTALTGLTLNYSGSLDTSGNSFGSTSPNNATGIKSLDLIKNVNLNSLSVQGVYGITSLNVSSISDLTYLRVKSGNLNCVQVSQSQLDIAQSPINDNYNNWERSRNSTYYSLNCNVNQSTYSFSATASGTTTDYTITGSDRQGDVSGNDPQILVNLGDTVVFNVDAPGHPLQIQYVQGLNETDNRFIFAYGNDNGTVTWFATTPGTYYYQCTAHNGMYGTITVQ